jgi:hypothetical protein
LCEEELFLVVYYVDHAKHDNERQQVEAGKLKDRVKAELQKRSGLKVDDKRAWKTWKFDQRQKAEAHKKAVTLHVANNLARTKNLIKGAKLAETQAELRFQLETLETTPPSSQASSAQASPRPTTSGFLEAFKLILDDSYYAFESHVNRQAELQKIAAEQNRQAFTIRYTDVEAKIVQLTAVFRDTGEPTTLYFHFTGLSHALLEEGVGPGILLRPHIETPFKALLNCNKVGRRSFERDIEREENIREIWERIEADNYRIKYSSSKQTTTKRKLTMP